MHCKNIAAKVGQTVTVTENGRKLPMKPSGLASEEGRQHKAMAAAEPECTEKFQALSIGEDPQNAQYHWTTSCRIVS